MVGRAAGAQLAPGPPPGNPRVHRPHLPPAVLAPDAQTPSNTGLPERESLVALGKRLFGRDGLEPRTTPSAAFPPVVL
jgi:hypothetical protein